MKLKKILNLLALLFIVLVAGVFVIGYRSSQPLSKSDAVNHLRQYFEKTGKASNEFSGVQVAISSKRLGIDESLGFGTIVSADNQPLDANQPFHVASVGKLFTATATIMLAEEGKLTLNDPVSNILDSNTLAKLFVVENIDYSKDVTIRQLLSHTSGVADYFGGPVTQGTVFVDQFLSQPDTLWTPASLLDFSRNNQVAVGKPGETYHYSDTGYILLGLILEKIEQKSLDQVFADRFFTPLQMDDTYLMFYGTAKNQPHKPLADIWFKGHNVTQYKSLSADWAGGGIISTPRDLIAFHTALQTGKLIDSEHLEEMFAAKNKFESGIYNGMGGMEIHFGDFFFLLKGLPNLHGHIGILSTHLFYDASTDTYIVMNFGNDAKMVDSFKALIEVMNTIQRIR